MAADEPDPDAEMFDMCAAFLRTHSISSNEEKLQIYSQFKQATVGDCNISKPSFFDFAGQAKWEAWKKLEGKTQKEARAAYIRHVLDRYPDEFRDYCALNPPDAGAEGEEKSTGDSGGLAPAVSTLGGDMAPTTAGEASAAAAEGMLSPEELQSLLGLAAKGEVEALGKALEEGADVTMKDEDSRTALHWAAESGHATCVGALLAAGAEVDAVDGDGQTPLLTSCLCEHLEVIELLLNAGAAREHADGDGDTPLAVAMASTSEELKALFAE